MFRRMSKTENAVDAQEREFENKSNEGVRMIAAMCPPTKRLLGKSLHNMKKDIYAKVISRLG